MKNVEDEAVSLSVAVVVSTRRQCGLINSRSRVIHTIKNLTLAFDSVDFYFYLTVIDPCPVLFFSSLPISPSLFLLSISSSISPSLSFSPTRSSIGLLEPTNITMCLLTVI